MIDIKDLDTTLNSEKEIYDLFAKAFFSHAETNLNESLIFGIKQ